VWLIAAGAAGALAVVLAWPVPVILAGARWPDRHPRGAIALWQAIGLVGGISALGALALVGFAPLGAAWTPVNLVALVLAAGLFSWLIGVLGISAVRIERDLRHQRSTVDLLASAQEADDGLRVLPHPEPIAYCVPGARPRIVVTDGAIAALSERELAAVLAHERAHARGRHELVIQPFVAWESALPFLRPARRATAAVAVLVEMLADDAAVAATSASDLARALIQVGAARAPGGQPTAGSSVVRRVRRLTAR
jgi:Zn-dependent protease with chaperone function